MKTSMITCRLTDSIASASEITVRLPQSHRHESLATTFFNLQTAADTLRVVMM